EWLTNFTRVLMLHDYQTGGCLGLVGDSEPTWDGSAWSSSSNFYYSQTMSKAYDLLMLNYWAYSGKLLNPIWTAWANAIMRLPNDESRGRGGYPREVGYVGKPGFITGYTSTRPPVGAGGSHVWPGIASDAFMLEMAGRVFGVCVMVEGDSSNTV